MRLNSSKHAHAPDDASPGGIRRDTLLRSISVLSSPLPFIFKTVTFDTIRVVVIARCGTSRFIPRRAREVNPFLPRRFQRHVTCIPDVPPSSQTFNHGLPRLRPDIQSSNEASQPLLTLEEFTHGEVVQAVRTVEDNALLRKCFRQVLGCFRFSRPSGAGRGTSQDHLPRQTTY